MPDTIQPAPVRKDDRIYLRTTRAQKERLASAASARQLQTTEFVLQAALGAADEILARENRIALSERDFGAFVAAIETPPEPPTPELLAAVEEYNARHRQYPPPELAIDHAIRRATEPIA